MSLSRSPVSRPLSPNPAALAVASLALAAGLAVSSAQAQNTFHRSIGTPQSETAYEVSRTDDGGFVTVGRIAPSLTAPADIYVVRYDACGDLVWSSLIGSANQRNDIGHSIRQTRDGGFIVAAETDSISQRFGIALIKLAPDGSPLWSRVYPGTPNLDSPSGVAVRELTDGSLVVSGRLQLGGGIINGVLHRVDPTGAPLQLRRYGVGVGAPGNLSFTDFVVTTNGFAISGWTQDNANAQTRAFFMRTDPAGGPLGARTYTAPDQPTTADAIIELPGGFGLSGRFGNTIVPISLGVVLRIDPTGAPVWQRIVPEFRPGFAAIANDDNQFLVLAGTTSGGADAGILQFDLAGNLVRGMRYGAAPAGRTQGHDVIEMPGRLGYAAVGETNMAPGVGQQDIHFVRTDNTLRSGCRENPNFVATFAQLVVNQPVVTVTPEQGVQEFPIFFQRPDTRNFAYCRDCCRADFNGDGVVDPDDLSDYIGCYFSTPPCPLADINNDSNVDPDDLSDYIGIYFAGCR